MTYATQVSGAMIHIPDFSEDWYRHSKVVREIHMKTES
jgi:hypothetical protein